jgi:hypothetical protein
MTGSETTTAAIEGTWSAGASGWVEHWARFAAPSREAVARARAVEASDSCTGTGLPSSP